MQGTVRKTRIQRTTKGTLCRWKILINALPWDLSMWKRAGGPALSFGLELSSAGGAGAVILRDLGPRLWWLLGQWGLSPARRPEKVDLTAWVPPDTQRGPRGGAIPSRGVVRADGRP